MKELEEVAVKYRLARAGLLSNGRYTSLVTEIGTGYSTFGDYQLTGWRSEAEGTFLYVEDLQNGLVWSGAMDPVRVRPDHYEARMSVGRFLLSRQDHGIETRTEACVVPDVDAEVRKFTLRNLSSRTRRLRLTTYTEVALNLPAADSLHPAFSKLFVQTEAVPEAGALIARRRPRSADERAPLFLQALVSPLDGTLATETDRAAFIGRGRSLREPKGLKGLGGGVGSVLDPVLSFQLDLTLEPGDEKDLVLVSAAAYTREEVLEIAGRMRDVQTRNQAFMDAALREQEVRERLALGPMNADRYHRVAAGVLLGNTELGASAEVLMEYGRGDADLVRIGLTRKRPLVVGRVADQTELAVARLVLRARDFWRTLGLRVQVLLFNDRTNSDSGTLHDELRRIIGQSEGGADAAVLLHSDAVPPEVQRAVQRMARLVVTGERTDLLHVRHGEESGNGLPIDLPDEPFLRVYEPMTDGGPAPGSGAGPARAGEPQQGAGRETLRFFNGIGGFSADAREYVIRLEPGPDGRLRLPPAPWTNVIANERAGFIVSETGAGFTWVGNSRENRLTPWHNDPVLDPSGEAFYIRDDDSGEIWSPLPGPLPSSDPVEVRHGFGYTSFSKHCHGIDHETIQFVPPKDPLKIVRIRLTNRSGRSRRLSAASYVQWVLGTVPDDGRFVVTEYDDVSGSIIAHSPHNRHAGTHAAFAALIVPEATAAAFTGDRRSFLGHGERLIDPLALRTRADFGERTGAGCRPCAALLKSFTMEDGGAVDLHFLLGQTRKREQSVGLVEKYSDPVQVERALSEVSSFWSDLVSGVQVQTGSPAIDVMVNGWLVYQDLSCRIWARSAFYQSGGAFGYRDQLQDASALAILEPEFTRRQILLHAAHQFEEGDVLHWWHPPAGEGIRTRFTDDLLWLPYAAIHYEQVTGDRTVWEEDVPYLTGPEIPSRDDEIFIHPRPSELVESLYRHCCRAIDRSLTRGAHGLPLMGSGDWNDGMNRVGLGGRGESVWLGFFLHDILEKFIPICQRHGDAERTETYGRFKSDLHAALNDAGWDGAWYRRAFYDDGEALGSAENDECKIDALAQSWAVISGVAPEDRARAALDATEERLISEDDGIIRLLAPPFDETPRDPGYIRGYLPGVRENGGQYTHAALWTVMALAQAGRCERAATLLEMLSPVTRSADVNRYKVEPYVIAADVYGVHPHVGRGGWTWYTGSAGWMYRVAVESILGIRMVGGHVLEIAPCIPSSWDGFSVRFRHPVHRTVFRIQVSGSGRTVIRAEMNGADVPLEDGRLRITMQPGAGEQEVTVLLGE